MNLVDNELSEPYSIFTYRCSAADTSSCLAAEILEPPAQQSCDEACTADLPCTSAAAYMLTGQVCDLYLV